MLTFISMQVDLCCKPPEDEKVQQCRFYKDHGVPQLTPWLLLKGYRKEGDTCEQIQYYSEGEVCGFVDCDSFCMTKDKLKSKKIIDCSPGTAVGFDGGYAVKVSVIFIFVFCT